MRGRDSEAWEPQMLLYLYLALKIKIFSLNIFNNVRHIQGAPFRPWVFQHWITMTLFSRFWQMSKISACWHTLCFLNNPKEKSQVQLNPKNEEATPNRHFSTQRVPETCAVRTIVFNVKRYDFSAFFRCVLTHG